MLRRIRHASNIDVDLQVKLDQALSQDVKSGSLAGKSLLISIKCVPSSLETVADAVRTLGGEVRTLVYPIGRVSAQIPGEALLNLARMDAVIMIFEIPEMCIA